MKYAIAIMSLMTVLSAQSVMADDITYSDSCGPTTPRFTEGVYKKFDAPSTMEDLATESAKLRKVDEIAAIPPELVEMMTGRSASANPSEVTSRSSILKMLEGSDFNKSTLGLTCLGCTSVPDNELDKFLGIVKIISHKFRPSIDPLKDDYSLNHCGGTLVHKNYILTAAHCLDPNSDTIEIIYGSSDYTDPKVGKAIANNAHCMKGFEIKNGGVDNDLALIDISDSSFDDLRNRLEVPNIADITPIAAKNPNNTILVTAGWGVRKTILDSRGQPVFEEGTDLREGRMKFYKYTVSTIFVQPHLYNGRTTSICSGDSGGPLYWLNADNKKELIGIVSSEGTPSLTCLEAYNGLFVNVAQHKSWLEKFPEWN